MNSYLQHLSYFFRLPWNVQWRTFLVQLPRYVPLSILHITSRKGPHPFVIALPSRKNSTIPIYVFVPPAPVDLGGKDRLVENGEWKVPVVLDFHGGGFIMGSPLEQAPYGAMMSRELGAVVISVSYRIGPFHQFPAAIHDSEDVLSAILDRDGTSKAGKVLRTEVQRYFGILQKNDKKKKKKKQRSTTPLDGIDTITLDPSKLAISGFSAGGNIALNMALSVPPCAQLLPTSPPLSPPPPADLTTDSSQTLTQASITPANTSKLLPPPRLMTKLDDPNQPWPTILPPPEAQPRMLPLLLFFPSLDARLLPHERPMKPLPNALKGDDKKPQTQRMPGLFSIMGPTYLPKKLRAHPRASPGLVDPENIQKNAAIFLVLPENDTLAVQSDVWVDVMNQSGWDGPVRFGDGRDHDWNGYEGPLTPSLTNGCHDNGGMEVWHAPECPHGWTQFPELVLGKHAKKERKLVFERTLAFVKEKWKMQIEVDRLGNLVQDWTPLQVPERAVRITGRFDGL